jgi:hypothetical protein
MSLSSIHYGFRPHTRAELEEAKGTLVLDATWGRDFTVAFMKVRGVPAHLVAVRRVKAVLDYGEVEFTTRLVDVLLPSHPEYERVAATIRNEADFAKQQLHEGRERLALERALQAPSRRKRSNRPRDFQRSLVYSWERSVLERTELNTPLGLQECQRVVDRWSTGFEVDPIRVTDGRGRRKPCWVRSDRSIRLPRWGRCLRVLAHEFAHARVSAEFERGAVAAHGPEFVARFITLLVEELGEPWDDLIDSAAEHGLKVA